MLGTQFRDYRGNNWICGITMINDVAEATVKMKWNNVDHVARHKMLSDGDHIWETDSEDAPECNGWMILNVRIGLRV